MTRDRALIILICAIVLGAGIGLRNPWPADEPRFALVAKEMVESGDWLFPTRAGVLYADKPPLFFWTIALFYAITGSLKIAFLLPTALAGIIVVLLVHDLSRRLWSRGVAFYAAFAMLVTVQFTLQARAAQIDGFLLLWTTLGIYGLARHFLLGPSWFWWYAAFAASGFGIISKGVGFLPLLMLIPLLYARKKQWRRVAQFRFPWYHVIGGVAVLLLAIAVWLVPMLIAVERSADPALEAYRNNILFKQTGERYARAWHHHQWFGYFVFQVLPWAWFPLTLAFPCAIAAWRRRLRRHDGALLAFLGWIVLVVLFFSASPGKRGVYILPTSPAIVLAFAPLLPGLVRRTAVRRAAAISLFVLAILMAAAGVALAIEHPKVAEALEGVSARTIAPPIFALSLFALLLLVFLRRRPPIALAVWLASLWFVFGFAVAPRIDAVRSSTALMERISSSLPKDAELGIVAWREQYVLHSDRPVTTFGYARRDLDEETREAFAWMRESPRRVLMVPEETVARCADQAQALRSGKANRRTWYLVPQRALLASCGGGP